MTQCELIREHLLAGNRLNAMDALAWFGCQRLAARISELRKSGMPITSRMVVVPNGRRFSSYALAA